jgi:FkbM family methyltransferase
MDLRDRDLSLHDRHWVAVADFIGHHRTEGETVLAPPEFCDVLSETVPYSSTDAGDLAGLHWLAIHKGMLDAIDPQLLERAASQLRPVFANEVFVVLCGRRDLAPLHSGNQHVRAFELALARHREAPSVALGERLIAPDGVGAISRQAFESACRGASQAVYLGDLTTVCRVLTRYLCYCDSTDLTLTPHLCLSGHWESWVTQAIARILRPGMRCLDLGANVGYFTLLMAGAVGPSGRVVAVEASPRLADLLSRTIEVNGFTDRVTVVQRAATGRSGDRLHLHVPPGRLGDGTVSMSSGADSVEVETVSVDDLLRAWESVDVVKVDIEGCEASAWQGMTALLERSPSVTVITEYDHRRSYDAAEFIRSVTSAGFQLRYLADDSTIAALGVEQALTEQRMRMLWLTRR